MYFLCFNMDTSINCDPRKSLLFSITKPVVFSFLVQYHRARYSQASSIAPRNHSSMWHFVSPWRLYYIAFTAVFHRVFFPRHSIFSFDRGKRLICWTKPCTNVFFHHSYPLSLSIYERQWMFVSCLFYGSHYDFGSWYNALQFEFNHLYIW